jgi:membrane protein DedA with SNARE-associated domain/rhodanese-related sulfurtransferase
MQHWVGHLGLPILFLLVLLQQAGLPYPVTPLLIIAGAAAARGHVNALDVIAVAAGAALTADLGWYIAGLRLGGRALRALCTLSLSPDSCVSDTERWFMRFGPRVLVVAKFVPALGLVSTAMSGVVRVNLDAFLAYDAIGNTLWAAAAVSVGIVFHNAVGDVLSTLASLGGWGALLVAALLLAFVAHRAWQRHALMRELRLARISVAELKELVDGGRHPVIIDARAPTSRHLEGTIPGSIPVEMLKLDSGADSLPREREIVVYCACPNEAAAARIAKQLKRLGLVKVRPLTGGIFAWKDAGFEVQPDSRSVRAAQPIDVNPFRTGG